MTTTPNPDPSDVTITRRVVDLDPYTLALIAQGNTYEAAADAEFVQARAKVPGAAEATRLLSAKAEATAEALGMYLGITTDDATDLIAANREV